MTTPQDQSDLQPWVHRAMARWPDVPDLYGWLRLDRRGRWWLRGERVTKPKLVDMIAGNYAVDARGCWFFQNGPQRGFVALEYTPLVLSAWPDGSLHTHTGRAIADIRQVLMDQDGSVVLDTDRGAGVLAGDDLDWAMQRLSVAESAGVLQLDDAVADALQQPDGSTTVLRLTCANTELPVQRCDAGALPDRLGFIREPAPPEAD